MELIKILWVVIFLFFSLILMFIWGKLFVIHKKVSAVREILTKNQVLDEEYKELQE